MVNRFAINNVHKGVPHASFSCINEYPNRSARGFRSNRPRSTLLAGEAPIAEYFLMSTSMKSSNQNDSPSGNDVSDFLKRISTLLLRSKKVILSALHVLLAAKMSCWEQCSTISMSYRLKRAKA